MSRRQLSICPAERQVIFDPANVAKAIAVSRIFPGSRLGRLIRSSENWARNEHCQSVSSQLKNLIGARHFDASVGKTAPQTSS